MQTIWPAKLFPKPKVTYRREVWDTPDGDVLAVDWAQPEPEEPSAPVMIHLHGLEGSSDSHYAKALMAYCRDNKIRGLVVNYRGCGGLPNKMLRAYTAADDPEWDWVFKRIKDRYPSSRIFAMGVSLGANNILHWLGTRGEDAAKLIDAAVAINSPMDLLLSNERVTQGFSRVYEQNFLFTLKLKALQRARAYPGAIDLARLKAAHNIFAFDDVFTAPIHGYKSGEDYYRRCSSRPFLNGIRVPTLVLSTLNDPVVGKKCLPEEKEVSSQVVLEYAAEGGHCGFPLGPFPGCLGYLPKRTGEFCRQFL